MRKQRGKTYDVRKRNVPSPGKSLEELPGIEDACGQCRWICKELICNAMEAEGKIQYGNVTESTTVTTDGDTCGFDIEVIDLDSAEHIYLNYYFQFSTIVAASGE